MLTEGLWLSFSWTLNQDLGPFTLKKLPHLLDYLMFRC